MGCIEFHGSLSLLSLPGGDENITALSTYYVTFYIGLLNIRPCLHLAIL